ncbi:MAG: hypothetical protein SFY70_04920 [Bacteroidia bacterium]|nr:hypothetical protein [Bacteroidia bacterium]
MRATHAIVPTILTLFWMPIKVKSQVQEISLLSAYIDSSVLSNKDMNYFKTTEGISEIRDKIIRKHFSFGDTVFGLESIHHTSRNNLPQRILTITLWSREFLITKECTYQYDKRTHRATFVRVNSTRKVSYNSILDLARKLSSDAGYGDLKYLITFEFEDLVRRITIQPRISHVSVERICYLKQPEIVKVHCDSK